MFSVLCRRSSHSEKICMRVRSGCHSVKRSGFLFNSVQSFLLSFSKEGCASTLTARKRAKHRFVALQYGEAVAWGSKKCGRAVDEPEKSVSSGTCFLSSL